MDAYNNLRMRFHTIKENYKAILSVAVFIMLMPAFLMAVEKKDESGDINKHAKILKDKTKQWKLRVEAASAIGNSRKKEGIIPLKEALAEDDHWAVRQNIIRALALIGDEEGVADILINTLNGDGSPVVRAEAANGLGTIGSKRGINALNNALKDESVVTKMAANGKKSVQVRVVSEAAEAALKKIGGVTLAGNEIKDAGSKNSGIKNPAETVKKEQPKQGTDKKDGVITVNIKEAAPVVNKDEKKTPAISTKVSTTSNPPVHKAEKEDKGIEKTKESKVPPAKTETAQSPNVKAPWVINVASYLSKENAKSASTLISSGGYKPYISEVDIKGNHWYRLRVGFFETESDARNKEKEIKELYNMYDAWISKLSQGEILNEAK